ncbi:hypothetical protein P9G84_16355 [Brevibacillus centrosporus]|uniref:hypothetical protein n=1 Tax=Brevibacillus centrosporus TaxID=54910 RepID=UPI000F09C349|nr:hypothetical protein [Brevibacillus centrosporus]MEC2130508.1 hypothetical protein [Brevibacillus centrosporus]RNB68890.1 hypothetical protein EDM55_15885 [Brevibacillus centrosporus]GED32742.1 hypothetical protein BCE02nite_38830 [Brevibacillus centrosporus]
MNKKVALSVLSATVFASMAASAFAAPKSGLYIGGNVDKYYSMNTLLGGMSSSALDQFSTEIGSAGFSNLIYVDFDGKGASIAEIMSATDFDSVKKDLTADKFEGVYSNIKADGSADGTYDPRNDAIDTPAGDLKVESVSAINATQLEVKFGTQVDKTTAETLTNYSFDGKSGGGTDDYLLATNGAVLQADGKTVILTLDPANYTYAKGKAWAVVVEGVQKKDDASQVIAKWANTVVIEDTTAPTVAEVTSKANGTTTNVSVKFSEPVEGSGIYKINGVTAAATPSATNPYVVNLVAGEALEAGKSYTLTIVNEEDLAVVSGAGNLVTTTKSFTVTGDAAAEGVKTVTVVDDNKVLVEFKDDMNPGKVTTTEVKVLDENGAALTATTEYTVSQPDLNDDTKFLVTIVDPTLFDDSNTRDLNLVVTNAAEDALGNKVASTTKAFKVTKDAVKPVAQSARVLKNTDGDVTGFEVTFDSNLTVGAPVTTGIRVINAAGTEITGTLGLATSTGAVTATAQNKLVVDLPADVALSSSVNGDVTILLPAALVQDDAFAQNTSSAKTLTVNLGAADTTKMTATVAPVAGSDNVYTVVFSEAVTTGSGAGGVSNPSNYKLNDVALPANTIITYVAATRTATIELPANYVTKDAADGILTVSGVKNSTGTKTVETVHTAVPTVDQVAPTLTAAKFLSDTTIELTYSEAMEDPSSALVGDEFLIKQGTTAVTLADAALVATKVSGFPNKVLLTVTGVPTTFDLTKAHTITTVDDGAGNNITDKVDVAETPNAQEADVKVDITK